MKITQPSTTTQHFFSRHKLSSPCHKAFFFVAFITDRYISFFKKKFIVVQLQLSQFFPCFSPLPHPPPAPTVSPHPVVHVHRSFIHVPWLDPFPSFPCSPSLPSSLVTYQFVPLSPPLWSLISLFLISMLLVLLCLFVCFVLFIMFYL